MIDEFRYKTYADLAYSGKTKEKIEAAEKLLKDINLSASIMFARSDMFSAAKVSSFNDVLKLFKKQDTFQVAHEVKLSFEKEKFTNQEVKLLIVETEDYKIEFEYIEKGYPSDMIPTPLFGLKEKGVVNIYQVRFRIAYGEYEKFREDADAIKAVYPPHINETVEPPK